VDSLAPLLANQRTIYAVVGVLVIWAAWSLSQLYWRTASLIAILRRARSWILTAADPHGFTASFEATAQRIATLDPLSARWSAYRDTLIIPDPDAPAQLIRSTLPPDQLFDLGLLRAVGLRPRYHAAMPGLLVGAGLLFTFFGLAIALLAAGDVVAGADPIQRQQGLHQLLNAASFKFFTSLAGLALSITYTLARNSRLRSVEIAVDGFNLALERQMPLATPAFLQHEANDTLRKQSAALETFGTELAVNIGQALDTAFDQRLGEHIGPLTNAMQLLANRIGAQNEDAMRQMLQAFIDRLSGGTRDHLAEVTGKLATLGTQLEGLQTGLGEASVRMVQAAEQVATRMGDGAEAALGRITEQMGAVLETLRSVAAQTRDAGAQAAEKLSARIEAAAAGFEAAAAQIAERFDQAGRGTSEALNRGADEAATGLQAAGQALARQATTLSATAEGLATRMGEGAEAALRKITDQIGTLLEALQNVTAETREAGADAAQALASRIETAAAGFEAGAIELSERLAQAASGTSEAFSRAAAGTSEALTQSATVASTELQAAAQAVRETLDRSGQGLARQATALAATAEALAARVNELDRAAREAVAPFAAGAADLRRTAEAAQTATGPLREVASSLATAVDQMGGAAQRFAEAQASTAILSQDMAAAAQRFEGIDRALATTLSRLGEALDGFAHRVQEFVLNVD
jgi:hypothetical protein